MFLAKSIRVRHKYVVEQNISVHYHYLNEHCCLRDLYEFRIATNSHCRNNKTFFFLINLENILPVFLYL